MGKGSIIDFYYKYVIVELVKYHTTRPTRSHR